MMASKRPGDRSRDELAEGTFERSTLVGRGPDLAGGIKVPVTPELLHHLVLGDTKLGTVVLGEALEREGPLVETGSEGDSSLGGVDLHVSERFVVVGGDNHVDGFNGTPEGLVEFFGGQLELEQSAIDFVDHEHRLDTFRDGLTEHGLGLHAHSINGIDHDQSTIGDTERGRNFGRKVNVTGTINQVDQVRVLGNLHVRFGVLLGGDIGIAGGLFLLG